MIVMNGVMCDKCRIIIRYVPTKEDLEVKFHECERCNPNQVKAVEVKPTKKTKEKK